jgi:hypothetical protein
MQERGLVQTDLAALAPGANYLRLRPPEEFASRRFRYGGWMAVDIQGLPTPLPLSRTAANRMIPKSDGYGEHLVVTTAVTPNDLHFDTFTLPTSEEALADFFAEFGRTARPSPLRDG